MNLGNNQLTGEIPAELGQLTQLTDLNLGGNQLIGTIPASLGNLIRLTELDLYGNRLSGTIPASLGNLIDLDYLSLATDTGLCLGPRLSTDIHVCKDGSGSHTPYRRLQRGHPRRSHAGSVHPGLCAFRPMGLASLPIWCS